MPIGGPQQYLVKYNNYQLPGYLQSESFDNQLNIASHYGAYIDGSYSEDTGLSNKNISLTLKVWECDYGTVKEQTQLAATELRSRRGNFAPLYVMNSDKHYDAMVKSIKYDKSVPSSVKIGEYQVDFECRPWLIGEEVKTITGTGTIDTDQVSRTIANGTWTPATVSIFGTDVTISGYTATGEYTGFISVIGTVNDLVVDTETFTATMGAVNRNDLLASVDYQLFVGPEKTYFDVSGGSVIITYYDRWAL